MSCNYNVLHVYENKPGLVIQFPEKSKTSRTTVVQPGEHPVDAAQRVKSHETAVRELDSIDEVNRMVTYFLERGKFRDACFFVVGCNTALRPGDVLVLRWKDFFNEDMSLRSGIDIIESKEQKRKTICYNEAVREAVLLYKNNLRRPFYLDGYVFVSEGSRSGHIPLEQRGLPAKKRKPTVEVQPISRFTATKVIQKAAKELGLYTDDRHISAYTMRKTALNATGGFMDGVDLQKGTIDKIVGLMLAKSMGNHADFATTSKHYLHLEDKVLGEVTLKMNLGLEAIQRYKDMSK